MEHLLMSAAAWIGAVAVYLVVASVIGLIPATLARSKGRSFSTWWAISVLLAGIFAVIPVALLPVRRCQACQEVVRPTATRCPHCQAEITTPISVASAAPPDLKLLFGLVVVLVAVAVAAVVIVAFGSNMSTTGATVLTAASVLVFATVLVIAREATFR
jgi:hypothetical protein